MLTVSLSSATGSVTISELIVGIDMSLFALQPPWQSVRFQHRRNIVPILGKQQSRKIWMPLKSAPEHFRCFALVIIYARVYLNQRWKNCIRRRNTGCHSQNDSSVISRVHCA